MILSALPTVQLSPQYPWIVLLVIGFSSLRTGRSQKKLGYGSTGWGTMATLFSVIKGWTLRHTLGHVMKSKPVPNMQYMWVIFPWHPPPNTFVPLCRTVDLQHGLEWTPCKESSDWQRKQLSSSFKFNLTFLDIFGCGDDGLIHWDDCCFPLWGVHWFIVSMVCSMYQVVTTHLQMNLTSELIAT